jgi:formate dehydrogenase major subunit
MSLAPLAQAQELRIKHARPRPVCPYCSVGCARSCTPLKERSSTSKAIRGARQRAPSAPRGGHLPAHISPNRATKVLHRAPGAAEWEVWSLDRAMDRVAGS